MMTESVGETGRWLVDRVARSPVSFLPASIYTNSAFPSDSCNQNAGVYTIYSASVVNE